jgi:hypothetical protein
MSVIRCKFPQLAVVKGLIADKRQKLEMGTSLLTYRVARRSYGVICMEQYNPNIHIGEDVMMDKFIPGKMWATNQIDWIIKKVLPMQTFLATVPLLTDSIREIALLLTRPRSGLSPGS